MPAMQHLTLHIHFDEDSRSFWADSPDLDGLIVSGQTPAEVMREAHAAARALLEINGASAQGLTISPQLITELETA